MPSPARKLSVVRETVPASRQVKSPRKASARPTKATLAAKRREEYLSYVVAVGALVGLFLSGIDSTFALNAFIKVPLWRAAMLAVIIDGLLVGAEIATLISPCSKVIKTSYVYIGMAGSLSIALNAVELSSHGTTGEEKILSGIVGGLIPCLVLVGSRYAGYLYLSSR